MSEQKNKKQNTASLVATIVVAVLAIAAVVAMIFVMNGGEKKQEISVSEDFRPTAEFEQECEYQAHDLVKGGFDVIRLFVTQGLPHKDEPYGNAPEDGIYTVDTEKSGEYKTLSDITCNNAGLNSAAMQGNMNLKGRLRMDRDTILIGDLSSQYADINGRVRGKLDIVGKAELKRDAIVFGDINASTIAVTDGAIIQGYVNTTFLSKDDSRNVFPDAISLDSKETKSE